MGQSFITFLKALAIMTLAGFGTGSFAMAARLRETEPGFEVLTGFGVFFLVGALLLYRAGFMRRSPS